MVETLIFRFDPFPTFKFSLPQQVDWTGDKSLALRNQINNNRFNLDRLRSECQHGINPVSTIVNIDGQLYTQPYETDQCQAFLSRVVNYSEVGQLDMDAIFQIDYTVDLYAIIILYNDEYYGHIYTWVSPHDPKYCLFIGIRNRIDSIFLQNTEHELKGVSTYLINGVKEFAKSQGCQKIVVVYPEPIMRTILPKMGFVPEPIPVNLFGHSVQTIDTQLNVKCNTCLSLIIERD